MEDFLCLVSLSAATSFFSSRRNKTTKIRIVYCLLANFDIRNRRRTSLSFFAFSYPVKSFQLFDFVCYYQSLVISDSSTKENT